MAKDSPVVPQTLMVHPQSSHHLHMLSPTNGHGVGAGTCRYFCHQLSMLWDLSLCIRVHGTVQASSFYIQPKGEGKVFACS